MAAMKLCAEFEGCMTGRSLSEARWFGIQKCVIEWKYSIEAASQDYLRALRSNQRTASYRSLYDRKLVRLAAINAKNWRSARLPCYRTFMPWATHACAAWLGLDLLLQWRSTDELDPNRVR